jgi:hypothetical protein
MYDKAGTLDKAPNNQSFTAEAQRRNLRTEDKASPNMHIILCPHREEIPEDMNLYYLQGKYLQGLMKDTGKPF